MILKFNGFDHANYYKGAGVYVLKGEHCEVTKEDGERLLKTFPKAFSKADKEITADRVTRRLPSVRARTLKPDGDADKGEAKS